jgi:hypothetical protein
VTTVVPLGMLGDGACDRLCGRVHEVELHEPGDAAAQIAVQRGADRGHSSRGAMNTS